MHGMRPMRGPKALTSRLAKTGVYLPPFRISTIVNTTPKARVAAVNADTRYSGQFNRNGMLSINAMTAALETTNKYRMLDPLNGAPPP